MAKKPTRLNHTQRAVARSGMQRANVSPRYDVLMIWPDRRMVTETVVIGWAEDTWLTAYGTWPDDNGGPRLPPEHPMPAWTLATAKAYLSNRGLVEFGR